MRLFLAVVVLLFSSQQPNRKPLVSQQPTTADERGTQDSPVVVKVVPSPKTPEEAAQESQDRKAKADNDRNLVNATWVLAGIGVLQLIVFGLQAAMLKKTVQSGATQSAAMDRHIGETTRSANAMEDIATKIQAGNKAILRAYLTVTVGNIHLYQERRDDKRFESRPNLTNTGNSPARNVSIQISADILPIPIPREFNFPLPDPEIRNAGIVGSREIMTLAGTVKELVSDSEVGLIKEGRTKALCVWGLITYEDIFGAPHHTKFGQWLTWNPNGAVVGYYIAGQNDFD